MRFSRPPLLSLKRRPKAIVESQPQQEPPTPEWLLAVGGIVGVVLAGVLMQRIFPRQVKYVHKDERGKEKE